MDLSMYIKTPQLIGIIAGIVVFSITISVVFYLLYASGSFSKLLDELKSDQGPKKKKVDTTPQFDDQPQLYDELLTARVALAKGLQPPEILKGKTVSIRTMASQDITAIHGVCDGRAVFHESAYDLARIWGWLDVEAYRMNQNTLTTASVLTLLQAMNEGARKDSLHFTIIDVELQKAIGMVTVTDNCPRNLSIRIDNLWITPAFQGKRRAHETMLLILEWLFKQGYRRITAEVVERHIIGRKFLERCGFTLECILRKHKILQQRNSNTALYVVLNSEWVDVERKLKGYLGISLAPPVHKIASIEAEPVALVKVKKSTKKGKVKKGGSA